MIYIFRLEKQDEYKNKRLLEIEQELRETLKQKDKELLELVNVARTRQQELVTQRQQAQQSVQKSELCQQQLDKIKKEFKDLQNKYQRDLNQKTETISGLMNDNVAIKVQYEEEIDKKNAKIIELMSDTSKVDEIVRKKDKEIEKLTEDNEKLSNELVFKENQELTQMMQEVDKKDNYIQTLLSENEANVKLCKELEKQVHELNMNKEFDRLNHELVHKDEEIRQNVKTIKQMKSEVASKEDKMKKLIRQNSELAEKVKSLETEIENLGVDNETKRGIIDKLRKENQDLIQAKRSETKLELEEVNDEIKRVEELLKETECERAGLLTKEKRREEEIKRLKEEISKYKLIVEERDEMATMLAELKQNAKDVVYYEDMKDKLEAEIERMRADSTEKIKLRDKELDKKHEAIAEMKLIMEENLRKLSYLEKELVSSKQW